MRLIGLLSWFDEEPAVLNQCLLGMRLAGVEHVVAVDGRYELYEHEDHASTLTQQGALAAIARSLGLGITLYVPGGPWRGEIEKRTHMFDLALAESMPGDWYLVVDADVVVTKVPENLHELLSKTEADVAAVTVHDMNAAAAQRADWPEYFDIRCLFRAQPLRVEVNHHTYVTLDGRKLWTAAGEGRGEPEPALDLRGPMIIQHRQGSRPAERQFASQAYYERREEQGIERGVCVQCAREGLKVRAARRVPVRWRKEKAGIVSEIEELCQKHIDAAEAANHRRMRAWGILCSCHVRRPDQAGLCASCRKPIKAETAYRVVERNGRPQIGVRA